MAVPRALVGLPDKRYSRLTTLMGPCRVDGSGGAARARIKIVAAVSLNEDKPGA